MDPISAAGIGLSVSALVLQVFVGCVRGEKSSPLGMYKLNSVTGKRLSAVRRGGWHAGSISTFPYASANRADSVA